MHPTSPAPRPARAPDQPVPPTSPASGPARRPANGLRMSYAMSIDRRYPGCFVFLLDQSYSMNDPMGGRAGVSKSLQLANAINNLLVDIIRRCTKFRNEPPRHYYDIAIIGYSGGAAES